MKTRGAYSTQLVFGLFLLILGSTLILDRLDILEARAILRFWPVAIIAFGANMYFQSPERSSRVGGFSAMLLGSWMLLTFTGLLPARSWVLFWPVLMVVGGGALVLQSMRRAGEPPHDSRGRLQFVGIMGGGKRTSDANPFIGADLTAIMGGGLLDLRRAVIPPGGQASIEIFSLMGGFEILVPDTWTIEDRMLPFMGGVQDDTRPLAVGSQPATLVVNGFVMMGGIHFK